jgi:uncharacterized membrane protein
MPEDDRREESSNIIPADTDDAPQKKPRPSSGRLSISASQEVIYHSPIPPPQILAGYNTIVAPDAGDRILRLVERQEEHRQYLEKCVIEGDNRRADRGLICGTSVVLATILLTAYLAYLKQPSYGIAAIITELAILGGVFVYNTKRREAERKDRLETLAKNRQPKSKDQAPKASPEDEDEEGLPSKQ